MLLSESDLAKRITENSSPNYRTAHRLMRVVQMYLFGASKRIRRAMKCIKNQDPTVGSDISL